MRSMIIVTNERRFRGGKVTDRSKVIAPTSIGDATNDRNNNLTKSMESLMNNKVSEMVGIINIDRNERSALV